MVTMHHNTTVLDTYLQSFVITGTVRMQEWLPIPDTNCEVADIEHVKKLVKVNTNCAISAASAPTTKDKALATDSRRT